MSKRLVLVHGTVPLKPSPEEIFPWTADEAILPRGLRDLGYGPEVTHRHNWSGANDHDARLSAALGLQERVSETLREDPDARFLFIGHSHAGNVILYALRDPVIQKSTDAVVCLGTPFLRVEPRPRLEPARNRSKRVLGPRGAMLQGAFLLGVEALAMWGAGEQSADDGWPGNGRGHLWHAGATTCAVIALVSLVTGMLLPRLEAARERMLLAALREKLDRLVPKAPTGIPILHVYGAEDEARAWLGQVSETAQKIPPLSREFMEAIWFYAGPVLLLGPTVLRVLGPGVADGRPWILPLVGLLIFGLFVGLPLFEYALPLVVGAAIAALRGTPAAYGEGFSDALLLWVGADVAPADAPASFETVSIPNRLLFEGAEHPEPLAHGSMLTAPAVAEQVRAWH